MDRLKNAIYGAGAIVIAAAIVFVALVFIGGALAITGIVIAVLILAGGVMSLFGKKPFGRGRSPITVIYTRLEETDKNAENRQQKRFP